MLEKSDLRVSAPKRCYGEVSSKKLIWFFTILLVVFLPIFVQAESTDNFRSPMEQIRATIIKQTHYPNQYFEIDPLVGDSKSFIYLDDQKIAEVNEQGEIYYHINDHLGSQAVTVNEEGKILNKKDYLSYGKINYEDDQINNPYGFSGKELDDQTELNYFEQRYYDGELGKFISLDPLLLETPQDILSDPQQLNSYTYSRGNPLRFVDKDGKKVSEFQPYYSNNGFYEYQKPYGTYRGIDIISAGARSGKTDHPYQCVEIVKTFARNTYKVELGGTGPAYNYGKQEKLDQTFINHNNSGAYTVYQNGSNVIPQENDIISWSGGNTGHVGLIVEVTFNENSDKGYVYTLEQNYNGRQGLYAQSFTRSHQNGESIYSVNNRGSLNVQGWARYSGQQRIPYSNILYTPAPRSYIYNN